MNKLLVVQITLLIVFAGAFTGMVAYTDVYDDIKSTIVDKTCFSCIKMNPITRFIFHCKTVNNQDHPDYILENLTKGPVFLAFRSDVCHACDEMDPVLKDLFNVDFGEYEIFYQTLKLDGKNITFYHINVNPPYEKQTDLFFIYDAYFRSGVPMFVIITLGKCNGKIKPYYLTAYSTVTKDFLEKAISKGFEYYNEYDEEYNPNDT